MVTSLAISNSIKAYVGADTKIKWPNDIFFEEEKLGGILIENSIRKNKIESSIVGIGINVFQKEFSYDKAVSLASIVPFPINLDELFQEILLHFEAQYLRLRSSHLDELHSEYHDKMYLINQPGIFHAENKKFEGKIIGINQDGRLRIKTSDKIREFQFKEVQYVRN
jgi:BirA family biotin operon repressor/biotin-[acetyl-CoA-carboxylase] ligase